MTEEKKAKFNLLKKANEITDSKGNVLIVSRQEIVQPDDSKSEHLVISKVRRNVDGTQQGNAKSLFVPHSLVTQLLKTVEIIMK